MHCDQFLTPFLLANLLSGLKVSLKVKLIIGGCLQTLEEDIPPPKSVLRAIVKTSCLFLLLLFLKNVRKISILAVIYERKMEEETGREGSFLFTKNSQFTQTKGHSLHSRFRKSAKVSIPRGKSRGLGHLEPLVIQEERATLPPNHPRVKNREINSTE